MDDAQLRLDGNAAAGMLRDVFVNDLTTARGACASCGAIAEMGSQHLYMYPLSPGAVKQPEVRGELLETAGHESIRDPSPVALTSSRWRTHQISQALVFPVDIAALVGRMVDFEKRVGLAAHCAIAEQRADDDLTLHFRQTSHGITQLIAPFGRRFRGGLHRY